MCLTLYTNLHPYLKVIRLFSTSNILGNHYEVLNLPRNATAKEIKESFIKLSKENHPDINKSNNAHKKFLEINEAYKVLSKPQSRELYDLGFSDLTTSERKGRTHVYYKEQFGTDPWKDSAFYMNRDKSRDKYYESQPYYGIKGIKKFSNVTIVLVCLSLAAIVLGLQILAVRNSFTLRRDEMIRKSNEAHDSLKKITETAALNGNELQIALLKSRMENFTKNRRDI